LKHPPIAAACPLGFGHFPASSPFKSSSALSLKPIPLFLLFVMSTFGTLFRVTTYGESHCASVGAIIDGCPPVRASITRKH
jgi:hypothetical protein